MNRYVRAIWLLGTGLALFVVVEHHALFPQLDGTILLYVIGAVGFVGSMTVLSAMLKETKKP